MNDRDFVRGIAIDRQSSTSFAVQLERLLRDLIVRGEVAQGQRLPTEMEWCRLLGVSRTPVRQALGRLTARGLLERHPGRGTFVTTGASTADRLRVAEEVSVTIPAERWCWPLQRAAALWNEEHPERPVRLNFQIIGPVQLRSRLTMAVAQGAAADISVGDTVWIAEFAERGYLQSLTATNPRLAARVLADLAPPLRAHNVFHGELFAVAADADFTLLWYRRDWFENESIDPPETWGEWLAAARYFQRSAVRERYALGAFPLAFSGGEEAGEATTYGLLPILWSAGAEAFADQEVVLHSPEAEAAVEFVSGLVRKHRVASPDVVTMSWNGPALAFAAGSVAMALGGSYEAPLIRVASGWSEEEFHAKAGFLPIPAGPKGQRATVLGGLSYAVYRQSERPDLAFELIERANRPHILTEFCKRTGQNPPTVSATRALAAGADPYLHATAQFFAHARSRWPIPEYTRVSFQFRRMFESAIRGELEPAAAVARAATVIAGITGLPERGASGRGVSR